MAGTVRRHTSALEGEVSQTPRVHAKDSSSALKVSRNLETDFLGKTDLELLQQEDGHGPGPHHCADSHRSYAIQYLGDLEDGSSLLGLCKQVPNGLGKVPCVQVMLPTFGTKFKISNVEP
ncbi:hypothetical protein STEG23_004869 [Scotinomys teguina]